MGLIEIIREFEDGLGTPETMYFANGNSHIMLEFEDSGDYKDVFVYEIEEVIINEDLVVDNVIYSAGTKLLIEIHHETPTVYGHELPFQDLIDYIEGNYEQFSEGVTFITNFDNEWEYLEEFIGGKSYD